MLGASGKIGEWSQDQLSRFISQMLSRTSSLPRSLPLEHMEATSKLVVGDQLVLSPAAKKTIQALVPAPPIVPAPTFQRLNVDTSTVSAVNSAAEITLYTYTVPGNTMGTDKALWVRLFGKGVNRTTSGTLTLRLYWGGSVVATATFSVTPTDTDGNFDIWIANRGSASSQVLSGSIRYYQSVTAVGGVLATVNTASNQDVKITAQWNTASTLNDFEKYYAVTALLG